MIASPGRLLALCHIQKCPPPLNELIAIHPVNRDILRRVPRRLSITVSLHLFLRLQELADQQGRSTSNLCAYLLENVLLEVMPPARDNTGL